MTKSFGLLLAILLLSNSCVDDVEKQNSSIAREIDPSDRLYQFITEGLRFNPADVANFGDRYIVEGDIAFPKSSYVIPDDFTISAKSGIIHTDPPGVEAGTSNGRTKQWIADYNTRVAGGRQRIIRVRINSNIPTSGDLNIRPNITDAITKWNSISCSEIKFEITTRQDWHIDIFDDPSLPDSPGLVLGDTDYPSGGFPGARVRLNVDKMVDHPDRLAKVTGVIIHELGHAVGFRHTDWSSWGELQLGAVQVPQTPATDDLSVFKRGLPPSNDFTSNDKMAVRNAYPKFSDVTTCRAPFYYYWSSSLNDAFFTTQLTEKGGPEWNYAYQNIECFINTTAAASGTVPLYRFYSNANTDHAYKTTTPMSGYSGNGVAGYIYNTSGSGRVALHEHYSSIRTDHFYTVRTDMFTDYEYLGIVGYVYTTR